MSPLHTESTQSDEIDLAGFGLALLNGRRVIALCGAAAVLLSVLSTFFFVRSPVYEASSTVLVENRARKVVGGVILIDSYPKDLVEMATEVRRLASYRLLKPIIVEMDLAKDPEFGFGVSPSMTRQEQYTTAYKNLLDRMEVDSRKETNLIDLKVFSKDQDKALKISEAILQRYLAVQAGTFFGAFSEQGTEVDKLFEDPTWLATELERVQKNTRILQTPDTLSQIETLQKLEEISNSTVLLYGYYMSVLERNGYGQEFALNDLQLFSEILVPPYIDNPTESVWSFNAIIFSLFLGLFIGSALVLFRVTLRGRSCTPNFLTNKYNFPAMFHLSPSIEGGRTNEVSSIRDWFIFSEAKSSSILILNAPGKTGEGTLGLSLAESFAAAGKKALVISAYALPNAKGVFAYQVLETGSALDEAVTEIGKVSVLQIAPTVQAASDILPTTAFEAFLNSAREEYDAIIFAAEDTESTKAMSPLHPMSTSILLNCDPQKTYERSFAEFLRNLPASTDKISCVFWQ